VYASLDRDDDVLSVGLNRAVDALAKKLESVRTLGAHPADKEPVVVRKGRFGPYVQHGSMVANLPREVAMDAIGLDEALTLLAQKGKALKPRGGRKKAAGKSAAAPAKKTAAKKTPSRAKPKTSAAQPKAG